MAKDGTCAESPDSRPEETRMPLEKVTPLLFACCQVHDQSVSASVVDVLLAYKANVSATTEHSNTTALLLAARYQRPDLVVALLKSNPDTSVKDKWLRSPLFYTARNRDQESVRALLRTKLRTNDGSVHEAARSLHCDVLFQRLHAGHDANFTSTKHDGLTPLGELATYCDGYSPPSTIEGCVDALLNSKPNADPLKKWYGKTVLYLAMQNPMALEVTRAVVQRVMYNRMNDPANIFRIDGYNFSPTMYLEKGHFVGRLEVRQALIRFLKLHGAEDAYYADEQLDFQPPGACRLPPILEKADRQRKKHLQDLREMSQKQRHQLLAKQQLQDQYLQHQDEKQQQHLQHHAERFQQQEYQKVQGAETQPSVKQTENRQAAHHRHHLAELKQDLRSASQPAERPRTDLYLSIPPLAATQSTPARRSRTSSPRCTTPTCVPRKVRVSAVDVSYGTSILAFVSVMLGSGDVSISKFVAAK
ncbi:hypothetical protein LTR08_002757 [Meristemomyces frigidus]|nr:hypothetical protein LTR08_002757 [Meristemomyces frigidus]